MPQNFQERKTLSVAQPFMGEVIPCCGSPLCLSTCIVCGIFHTHVVPFELTPTHHALNLYTCRPNQSSKPVCTFQATYKIVHGWHNCTSSATMRTSDTAQCRFQNTRSTGTEDNHAIHAYQTFLPHIVSVPRVCKCILCVYVKGAHALHACLLVYTL